MKPMTRFYRDDRGAILVHVAVALLMLMAVSAFAIDYGLFWLGRRQAQNAADAGALAGAIALGFDNSQDKSDTGPAKRSAYTAALDNLIAAQVPAVDITTDITFPTCPDGSPSCIQVDVFRDVAHSNPLPTFFGNIVGLTNQGVQATATGEAMVGNATQCLKPWAVIDRWQDNWCGGAICNPSPSPWSALNSTFDKYKNNGTLDPTVTVPDVYTPPSANSPGTGFAPQDANGNLTADFGLELTLKIGGGTSQINPGNFQILNVDPNCTGGGSGNCYRNAIEGCVAGGAIGQNMSVDTSTGSKVGPTDQGTYSDGIPGGVGVGTSLCNQDPGAYWDPNLNGGHGGVHSDAFPGGNSPRIVAIPLISPDDFALSKNGIVNSLPIENIMGMFIECSPQPPSGTVRGRLMIIPGIKVTGGSVTPSASFLKVFALVQ